MTTETGVGDVHVVEEGVGAAGVHLEGRAGDLHPWQEFAREGVDDHGVVLNVVLRRAVQALAH